MQEISWLAEKLLASEEGLHYVELFGIETQMLDAYGLLVVHWKDKHVVA